MPYKKMSRRPRRKIARRRVRKARVSKTVKRYVKRAISAQAENKYTIARYTNQPIVTAVGTTMTNITLLNPLQAGSSRHNRVGNSVRLKRGYVKGFVNLLPQGVNNPEGTCIGVKIFLLASAQYNEIGLLSGSSMASGFYKSDTAPSGPTGGLLDLVLPIETENFRCYATKTIYLGTTGATNTFPSTSVTAYDNSRFSVPFSFSFSKWYKLLKFNDTASSSICTNRNCWLAFQAVNMSGTTTAVQAAEFHAMVVNEFEDL